MPGFLLCFPRLGLFFSPKHRRPGEQKADLLKSAGREGEGDWEGERATFPDVGGQLFPQHLCCLRDSPLQREMVSPKCWASC